MLKLAILYFLAYTHENQIWLENLKLIGAKQRLWVKFQSKIKTIEWVKTQTGGHSLMVDQTKIPYAFEKVEIKTLKSMYDAIKTMIVRGGAGV